MKYTPGPWIIEGDAINGLISTPFAGDEIIVRTGGRRTYADTRLIAATPELLEICKDFVAFDWEDSNLHWPTIAMWIARFNKAIAKAKGKETIR